MHDAISTNFKKYRIEKHYSKETVARLADIHVSTYSAIEKGLRRSEFITIYKICKVLQISLDNVIKVNRSNKAEIGFGRYWYNRNPTYRYTKTITRLRLIRKNLKITQEDLAKRSEISRSAYYQIEKGNAIPGVDTALKISKSLKVPVDKLFTLQDLSKKL